jgi:hypothetical protein
MKSFARSLLFIGLLAAVVQAQTPFPFKAPFVVKNAVIYDQDGRKVKLWGVNYLAPFNHNFANIQQSGADLKTAISVSATISRKTPFSGIRKPSPASSGICAGCSTTSTCFQKNA